MIRSILLTLFCFLAMTVACSAQGQADSQRPPVYLRFPSVPPFSMTAASGKVFSNKDLRKNTPTLIFLFSVDCEHCMHETEDVIKHIDEFKGTQIVMITPFKYNDMMSFYKGYGISKYPNITMGSDSTRRLNMFYDMHYFPGLYAYNSKNHIVFHFEGTVAADSLAYYLKK